MNEQDRINRQEQASYGDDRVKRLLDTENRGSSRMRTWTVTARADDAAYERRQRSGK